MVVFWKGAGVRRERGWNVGSRGTSCGHLLTIVGDGPISSSLAILTTTRRRHSSPTSRSHTHTHNHMVDDPDRQSPLHAAVTTGALLHSLHRWCWTKPNARRRAHNSILSSLTLPARHAKQGLCNGRVSVRPSVRPSVCPVDRQHQQRAAGLLLSAGARGIYRSKLVRGARAQQPANAGSVMLRVTVEGRGSTQACCFFSGYIVRLLLLLFIVYCYNICALRWCRR